MLINHSVIQKYLKAYQTDRSIFKSRCNEEFVASIIADNKKQEEITFLDWAHLVVSVLTVVFVITFIVVNIIR